MSSLLLYVTEVTDKQDRYKLQGINNRPDVETVAYILHRKQRDKNLCDRTKRDNDIYKYRRI